MHQDHIRNDCETNYLCFFLCQVIYSMAKDMLRFTVILFIYEKKKSEKNIMWHPYELLPKKKDNFWSTDSIALARIVESNEMITKISRYQMISFRKFQVT